MNTLPAPVALTMPEDCNSCRWCKKPINPTSQELKYPDGTFAHLVCPNAPWWGGCDHCGKPRMNCDCSDDTGFDRARLIAQQTGVK